MLFYVYTGQWVQVLIYLVTGISLPDHVDAKTSRSDQRHDSDDYSQHDHPRCHYNSQPVP